ncbi:MAG: sugar ABC transporter permease [Deltaproteobacteria bacterium]|nr:sugar ABC transporter permease [Deltaproteobacteria bacterium]
MTRGQVVQRVAAHAALVVGSVVALYPVLWVLKMAFSEGRTFASSVSPIPDAVSLNHFARVVGTTASDGTWLFGRQLMNSLWVSGATTVVGIVVATTAAYAFSRFRFAGRESTMGAFLVTQMFPGTMVMIPLYVLLDRLALLDTWTGLVLVYSSSALPFCVFMLKGYFDTIPTEIEEAARLDGASRLRIFWSLILPLARPAIAITALFSFMTAWNEYILAATFMGRDASYTLPVVLRSYVGERSADWGAFAAGAVLVSVPVMVFFLFLEKHLVGGLMQGAVKG